MDAQHGANRTSGAGDGFTRAVTGAVTGRVQPRRIRSITPTGDVMTTTTAIDQLKAAHRATWDSGDYTDVADRFVVPVGNAALEAAAIAPGTEVLDVAAGSGNPAIPAAQAGARVTALDLAPALVEIGRRRALDAGVEVDFVVGDAEALPFDDDRFDVVLSVVGVQFAPRHEVVAGEVARVVRPGGRIVLCSWTPRGFIGQFLKTVAPRMPKPPEGASPPPLWGDEAHVRELFQPAGIEFEFELRYADFEYGSAAGFVDYMAYHYGPLVKARERLSNEGTWDELRRDLVALTERSNVATDGFCARSEYLVARGVKDAS
jgi:SAM-dependent methyltransferase